MYDFFGARDAYVKTPEERRGDHKQFLREIATGVAVEVGARRDDVLAEYAARHERDVTGFTFSCERSGAFLCVEVHHGSRPDDDWRNVREALNLYKLDSLKFCPGLMLGKTVDVRIAFGAHQDKVTWRMYALRKGEALHNPTHDVDSGVTVPCWPLPAVDDEIEFTGIGGRLYAPAGLGEGVWRQMMAASAPRPAPA